MEIIKLEGESQMVLALPETNIHQETLEVTKRALSISFPPRAAKEEVTKNYKICHRINMQTFLVVLKPINSQVKVNPQLLERIAVRIQTFSRVFVVFFLLISLIPRIQSSSFSNLAMQNFPRLSQHEKGELSPLQNWKKKLVDDEPHPEAEHSEAVSLNDVTTKKIHTKEIGTGNISPSMVDELHLKTGSKSPTKRVEGHQLTVVLGSPANKPRRSLSTPEAAIELQRKMQQAAAEANKGSQMNSIVEETMKIDNTTMKSEKSFFDKWGLLSSLRKLGSKTNVSAKSQLLDNKSPSQMDISLESKPLKGSQDPTAENAKRSPREGNKLLGIILKHAASGNLSKEAEVLNKVLVLK